MAAEKRGAPFSDARPSFKKNKPNNFHRNGNPPQHAQHDRRNDQHKPGLGRLLDSYPKNRDNPVLDHISRLPEPDRCEPCKLAAAETQTGLISLLDKLATEELAVDGDLEIARHARGLHKLLSGRANKSLPTKPRRQLDEKRPEKEAYCTLPAHVHRTVKAAKGLPPLPPIREDYLREAVFTHRANSSDTTAKDFVARPLNYERLEYLGDAYIEVLASRLTYSRFPDMEVPQLCRLRETMVQNSKLAEFSHAYGLPARINHGGHIQATKAWDKIVADVFEAYVAALVLSDPENGFATAEEWLTELWAPQILDFKVQFIQDPRARDKVQSDLAFRGIKLDYVQERDMRVVNGEQNFLFGLYLTGWGYDREWLGSGEGVSKQMACVVAANDAIQRKNEAYQGAAKQRAAMREITLAEKAAKATAESAAARLGNEEASVMEGNSTTKEGEKSERGKEKHKATSDDSS